MESRKKYHVLLLVFVAVLASKTTFAQFANHTGVGFAMVGIAAGQTVSVNVANLAQVDPSPYTRSGCGITLQFLDDRGRVLKQTNVTLQPAKAESLDLRRDEVAGKDLRVRIRAVVLFGYSGGAPPGSGSQRILSCNSIAASLDVYDTTTGKTSFILTSVTPLPGPVSPAQ